MKRFSIRLIRLISTGLFVTVLSGCKSTAEIPESAAVCEEPRAQMCTMDYQPVCGYSSPTEANTYSNTCSACSHSEVKWVVEGSCQ